MLRLVQKWLLGKTGSIEAYEQGGLLCIREEQSHYEASSIICLGADAEEGLLQLLAGRQHERA